MRICLYTATALPKLGGQEAVVDSLARHFTRLGHEPIVLAPQPRRPLQAKDADLPYTMLRHPRFYSTRAFVSFYRWFLTRAHARFGFDVLHCHDVYPTGYLGALVKRKLGLPLVITSHGGDVRENNPRLEKGAIPQRSKLALQMADALISIGPFTERGFRRLFPGASRIATIANGIDLEPYQQRVARPCGMDCSIQQGRYVLYLGRLAHRKGVDVLLDALAKVPETGDVQLVIAGTGDEQSELESHVNPLGLAERVRFVGRVEGDTKIWLLQNALATVMPSRVWEAFPLVLLETFAAGRGVIGSRVPGICDLVSEGQTGRMFPDEDAASLSELLRDLFANPQRSEELGAEARLVAQNYSWDAIARQHLDLYERLIAGQRRG